MFKLRFLLFSLFLISCSDDKRIVFKDYQAIDSLNNKAILHITYDSINFYGMYKVEYVNKMKDSGTVKGKIYGDTLKGRYNYISYSGSKRIKPFVLLKDLNDLKMGSGKVFTYMHIPFFHPETLEFKSGDFRFSEIHKSE